MKGLVPSVVLAASVVWVSPSLGLRANPAAVQHTKTIELQKHALAKTQILLADKLMTREQEARRRTRAMYKLSRANWPRLWFEPEARGESSRWLGAARRIALRDVREIAMLHHEIALADRAEQRLDNEATLAVPVVPPTASLQWPVSDSSIVQAMGEYKGPSHRVKLRSRGIRLSTTSNQMVRPIAAGHIRYSGHIRGLGTSLIVDHGHWVSIMGNLEPAALKVGDKVSLSTTLGKASGETLYLEIRLKVGASSQNIDPAPLLVTAR